MTDLTAQLATWAAEDAAHLAVAAAERAYNDLIVALAAIEDAHRDFARNVRGELYLYLTDEGIDHENCTHEAPGSLAYWQAMYRSAATAAGGRAEDYGLDINALLGRCIY